MKNTSNLNKVLFLSLISLSLISYDASAGWFGRPRSNSAPAAISSISSMQRVSSRARRCFNWLMNHPGTTAIGAAALAGAGLAIWAGKKLYDRCNQPQVPQGPQEPSSAPGNRTQVGPTNQSDADAAAEQQVKEQVIKSVEDFSNNVHTAPAFLFGGAQPATQARGKPCPVIRILELLEPYAQQEWARQVTAIINEEIPVSGDFSCGLQQAYETYMRFLNSLEEKCRKEEASADDHSQVIQVGEMLNSKIWDIVRIVQDSMPPEVPRRYQFPAPGEQASANAPAT